MRSIKFRGKDKVTGEWFYGNLYAEDNRGRTHICTLERGCLRIDPETVGQFTGVDDVNGNPIFEGDIVETFSIYCAYRQVGDYPPPNVEVEEWAVKRSVNEVEFSYGSFNINGFPIMFEDMMSEDDEADKSFERREFENMWEDNSYDIRDKYPYLTWDYFLKPHIIGNIHDNPELLTGGSDGED